jgi:hypothetical protein
MFNQWIDNISKNPKFLFLIDGLGALLSAFLYYIVLSNLIAVFGIPKHALNLFCFLALGYAVFSLSTYFRNVDNWRPYMKIIALANLFHCVLTVIFLIYYNESITGIGLLYFVVEIIIVATLAVYELKTASTDKVQSNIHN